jgi:hypothetical protein
MLTPIRTTYKTSEVARAARRCAELQELNLKWPQARVRAMVAREMGVQTWVVLAAATCIKSLRAGLVNAMLVPFVHDIVANWLVRSPHYVAPVHP